jgi:hypothetical protein
MHRIKSMDYDSGCEIRSLALGIAVNALLQAIAERGGARFCEPGSVDQREVTQNPTSQAVRMQVCEKVNLLDLLSVMCLVYH